AGLRPVLLAVELSPASPRYFGGMPIAYPDSHDVPSAAPASPRSPDACRAEGQRSSSLLRRCGGSLLLPHMPGGRCGREPVRNTRLRLDDEPRASSGDFPDSQRAFTNDAIGRATLRAALQHHAGAHWDPVGGALSFEPGRFAALRA